MLFRSLQSLLLSGATENLGFKPFAGKLNESSNQLSWIIEEFEDGYAIRTSDDAEVNYLNLGAGSATLGAPQALQIEGTSGAFTISRLINGVRYYLRFTNSYALNGVSSSCFVSGISTASSTFSFYYISTLGQDDFDPTRVPLFTIAALSDPHTDYGIQVNNPYIRPGYIDAMENIRDEEKADVLLIGGDLTSRNDTDYAWSKTNYDHAISQIYSYSKSATASGRVLYATGNHDFVAGGATFNSGDYTEDMIKNVGHFKASLYQKDSPFPHVLGYSYGIDGVDFVVLNTEIGRAHV